MLARAEARAVAATRRGRATVERLGSERSAVASVPAEANTPPRVRRDCAGDAKRLCPKQTFDSPALRYCMEAKSRQLSNRCVQIGRAHV